MPDKKSDEKSAHKELFDRVAVRMKEARERALRHLRSCSNNNHSVDIEILDEVAEDIDYSILRGSYD